MKTFGIVAEYHPFHNGHKALVDWAKTQGYSHCIAVMSGNFVQRCSPAIAEKHIRTRAALAGGVDLVIELPLAFATATAQKFAQGAVGLLHATGIVDALCFGSEAGAAAPLADVCDILQSPEFSSVLQQYLSTGKTFAAARTCAVAEIAGADLANLLACPNNLLGIEYLMAASRCGWQVDYLTRTRLGTGHHSTSASGNFASASMLREFGTSIENLANYVPTESLAIYREAYEHGFYGIRTDRFEPAVLSHLRRAAPDSLHQLPDLSEGIENRLIKAVRSATSLEELYRAIKTKRYPLSRVRRLVLSAFLGLQHSDPDTAPPYLRILGIGHKGYELLARMKHHARLPFGSKLRILAETGPDAKRFAFLERQATDQYALWMQKPHAMGMEDYLPAITM